MSPRVVFGEDIIMKVRVLRDRFRGLLELLDHAVGSTTLREVAKQYGRKTKAWDMDHDSLITVGSFLSVGSAFSFSFGCFV